MNDLQCLHFVSICHRIYGRGYWFCFFILTLCLISFLQAKMKMSCHCMIMDPPHWKNGGSASDELEVLSTRLWVSTNRTSGNCMWHGPLARYAKLRVAHAPGMPGTFSPPPGMSDPDMHHGTCVTHLSWCMPGSLTSGVLWGRWRGKRSRHSRHMRNPHFYVSSKRPMTHVVKSLSDPYMCQWAWPPLDRVMAWLPQYIA